VSDAPAPAGGAAPADVLDFWFGAPPLAPRPEWFRKSEAFDARVRERFAPLVEQALAGDLPAPWHATPAGRLAQIILLDQFTRNLFRGSARAFAGDERALALATAMVGSGEHATLHPLQRWFVYLPFEHAEQLALQDQSVRLFGELAAGAAEGSELAASLHDALDYAHRHRDVIQRFGRYPHRNAALGRQSSPQEQAWLQQPGSGF
jgi:uncharacterized protein (DUF924 family)